MRMAQKDNPWTEERVEFVKVKWGEGWSARQIAEAIDGGRVFTRNSVIGKVHRLNLPGRAKPPPSRSRKRRRAPASIARRSHGPDLPPTPVRKLVARPSRVSMPASKNLTILELTNKTCKWAEGHPRDADFGFCGHKTWNKSPYCEHHSSRAYTPPDTRKRRRRGGFVLPKTGAQT